MIGWIERAAWRLFHRHVWESLAMLPNDNIVRQGCLVHGCAARRIVYDDGRRVGWRRRRELGRRRWVDLQSCRPDGSPATTTGRSAAIRRLDRVADRLLRRD